MSDLTLVLYTAGTISDGFAQNVLNQLDIAKPIDSELIIDLKEPDVPSGHFNIYRQALRGAKKATTKYIALCEDDTLYSPEHFNYRPKNKPFAYNLSYWGIYTWQDPPIYNYKGRRNLGNLICERQAFIDAMEERFAKYPDPPLSVKDVWAEPSKYERQLGVTIREAEDFYTQPPNIKFSHPTELSFQALGIRKRSGELRAYDIPYWGHVNGIRELYS